jgi:hypothetical protein
MARNTLLDQETYSKVSFQEGKWHLRNALLDPISPLGQPLLF